MDSGDFFRLFGPGVIYSRNTIQNLVSFYVQHISTDYEKELPFIGSPSSNPPQSQNMYYLDDLNRARAYLEDNLDLFVKKNEQIQNNPVNNQVHNDTVIDKIAQSFIFPGIQLLIKANPDICINVLDQVSRCILESNNCSKKDFFMLSKEVTSLFSTIITMDNPLLIAPEKTIDLWIEFFFKTNRIEDYLMIMKYVHKYNLFKSISGKIVDTHFRNNQAVVYFKDYIKESKRIPFYNLSLINSKKKHNFNEEDSINRKVAAKNGFLYVIDNNNGLQKIGTGKCGSVYSSLELDIKDMASNPESICVIDNLLLLQTKDNPKIEVYYSIDLSFMGYVDASGSISLSENGGSMISNGRFTSYSNILYYLLHNQVYVFLYENLKFSLTKVVEIDIPDHNRSIDDATLISNGVSLSIAFNPKCIGSPSVEIMEFSLEDGKCLQRYISDQLLSNCIAYDPDGKYICDLPDFSPSGLLLITKQCCLFEEYNGSIPTTIEFENFFNIIPSILFFSQSKKSQDEILFSLSDASIVFDSILYNVSIDNINHLQSSILIFCAFCDFLEGNIPENTYEICEKVLNSQVSQITKIRFFARILSYNNFFDIDRLLLSIPEEMFIYSVYRGSDLDPLYVKSILLNNNRFIGYCWKILTYENYSLIQKIITILSTHILTGGLLNSLYNIVPLLASMVFHDNHLFYSIFSLLMPIFRLSLKNSNVYLAIIPYIKTLLPMLHDSMPVLSLKDYANVFSLYSSDEVFGYKEIVDETPHPYHNNMDFRHYYFFPDACEILIEFDPKTATESMCDWLQIYADTQLLLPITDRISGTYNVWKTSIKLHSNYLTFVFHTDSSVTEWGYLARIRVKFFSVLNYFSPHPKFDMFNTLYEIMTQSLSYLTYRTIFETNRALVPNQMPDLSCEFGVCNSLKSIFDTIQLSNEEKECIFCHTTSFYYYVKDFCLSNIEDFFSSLFVFSPIGFNIEKKVSAFETNEIFNQIKHKLSTENCILALFSKTKISLGKILGIYNFFALMTRINYVNLSLFETLWFESLRIYSIIFDKPCSETQSVIKKCLKSIAKIMASQNYDFANHMFIMNSIIESIPNSQNENDIPIISVILNYLLDINFKDLDHNQILTILLRVLLFNIPNVTKLVERIIIKNRIMFKLPNQLFGKVLAKIGDLYNEQDAKESPNGYISGKKYSTLIAHCIRQVIFSDSPLFSYFSNPRSNEWIGILVVFSIDFYDICENNKYVINDVEFRLDSVLFDSLVFKTNVGSKLILPIFDWKSSSIHRRVFWECKPQTVEVMDFVQKFVFDSNKSIDDLGKFVLNYLNISDTIQLQEILKCLLSSVNHLEHNEDKWISPFLEMNCFLGLVYPGYFAYQSTSDCFSFSFYSEECPFYIGFCEKDNPIPSCSFLFYIDDQTIVYRNKVISNRQFIGPVTIGYFLDGFQIYIMIDEDYYMTGIFLPPMKNPRALILTKNEKFEYTQNPVISCPLNNKGVISCPKTPTHLRFNSNIICLKDIMKDFSISQSNRTVLFLFPSLSISSIPYYIEFSFKNSPFTVQLRSSSCFSLIHYEFTHNPEFDSVSNGLFIDFKSGMIFLTENEAIVTKSVFCVQITSFDFSFIIEKPCSFVFNCGQWPFNFNYKSYVPDTNNVSLFIPRVNHDNYSYMNGSSISQNNELYTNDTFFSVFESPYLIHNNKWGFGKKDKDNNNVELTLYNRKAMFFESSNCPDTICYPLLSILSNNGDSLIRNYISMRILYDKFFNNIISSSFYSFDLSFFMNLSPSCLWEIIVNTIIKILDYQPFYSLSIDIDHIELLKLIIIHTCSNEFFEKYICPQKNRLLYKLLFNHDCIVFDFMNLIFNSLIFNNVNLKLKKYIFVNNPISPISEVSLGVTDCIYVLFDSAKLSKNHIFRDKHGNYAIIGSDVNGMQMIFQGNSFCFDSLLPDELVSLSILPISFNDVNDESNIRVTIAMISNIIIFLKEINNNENLIIAFDEKIMFPIWRNFMDSKKSAFQYQLSLWFLELLNVKIFNETRLTKYINSFKASIIIERNPRILIGIIIIVISRIISKEQRGIFFNKMYSMMRTYSSFGFNIIRNLLYLDENNPVYESKANLLSLANGFSSYHIRYSCISNEYKTPESEHTFVLSLNSNDMVKMKLNDSLWNGEMYSSNGSVSICKNDQSSVDCMIYVISHISKQYIFHDILRISQIYEDEINKKWNNDYEGVARVIAYESHLNNNRFSIGIIPDCVCQIIFKDILIPTVRFRIASLYYAINEYDCTNSVDLSSGIPNDIFPFLPLMLRKDFSYLKKDYLPYTINHPIPFKNIRLSDFFICVGKIIDSIPSYIWLTLSQEFIHSNNKRHSFADVIGSIENDMFIDGAPILGADSKKYIESYQYFGTFMAINILQCVPLVLEINDDVFYTILGTYSGDTPQMKAIRIGSLKIELVSPLLKVLSQDRSFPHFYRIAYSTIGKSQFKIDDMRIITSPLFSIIIRYVIKGRKVNIIKRSNRFVFEYDPEDKSLIIPTNEALLSEL